MKIKNVSPLGAVSVPMLGREVDAGSVVDVTDSEASMLLRQPRHWEPADEPAEGLLAKLNTPDGDITDEAEGVEA